jgi:hypothetical protein
MPNINLRVPIPQLEKALNDRPGFNNVYKTLISDLAQVARLGVLHEVITSKVSYTENAEYYEMKKEDLRFLGKKSGWKIPM